MSNISADVNSNCTQENKSQQILESFYKEFFTWSAGNIGQWLAAGILEFIAGVFFWIPVQEFVGNDWTIFMLGLFCSVMGSYVYLMPYLQFMDGGKMCRVFQKLQYLPISLQDVKAYWLKKLCRFCLRMFLVFLAGQLVFSLVCNGTIGIQNLLYPVVCGLVVPMGVNSLVLWFARH